MEKNNDQMSDETIRSLKELAEVLRPILKRMIAEGKARVVDGKVEFLD